MMTHNVSIFKASLFVLVSFFQNKVRSWFPFFFILTPISSKLMYRPRAISAVSGGLENRRGRFEPGAFELFSTISWQKNEKNSPKQTMALSNSFALLFALVALLVLGECPSD